MLGGDRVLTPVCIHEPLLWPRAPPLLFSSFILVFFYSDWAVFFCRSLNTTLVSLYRCVLPPRPLIPDLCSDLESSSNHLIGKTVFPLSPYIPLPHQIGTSLISSLELDPGLWPPSRRNGGGQSDTLADRPRRRSEGSGPAAAKVQPVPGGPCQLELFLEAMFANSVLIVSLSKLWLPGLREGKSL